MAIIFDNNYYPNAKTGTGFTLDTHFPDREGIAFEYDGVYYACGLYNARNHIHFSKDISITLKDWVTHTFGSTTLTELPIMPGTYYKRMWRPNVGMARPLETASTQARTQASVSLQILLDKVENLFLTIEPSMENFSAYGHTIREILLLACMEFESSCKAILKENGYANSGNTSTNDYVKLYEPLILDSYELSLQSYPDIPSFYPFKDWDVLRPTQSLPWYNAYNSTKHDREQFLHLATLQNCITAVGACIILFEAQFGSQRPRHWFQSGGIFNKIRNIFYITNHFENYSDKVYIPKLELQHDGREEKPSVPTNSDTSTDWVPVNYPFE
jgi:hypothetical protein